MKTHFIGIGGIGISAIARMMLLEGKAVSGSDASFSLITKELHNLGAKIYQGHKAENLQEADLVVYTLAIAPDNPELQKAKKLKIPIRTYPEILGEISRDHYTIGVSGTHGKTTTTAMIGQILMDAKLDPTVVVGSLLKQHKSNFIAGKGKYFVCEACEHQRSFLNLNPKIIVITNIDKDHLDYYKDLKDIQNAFSQFVFKLSPRDFLVCNPKDKNLGPVLQKAKCQIVDYSRRSADFQLKIPGWHNILNAQAALATAEVLGVEKEVALRSLNNFSGTWRRFEYKGEMLNGALVYDDYGHHPTEIKATLVMVKSQFSNRRIVAVFQPHLFSRTKMLLEDFAQSFKNADVVIVTDIYAAREQKKIIHAQDLVGEIKKYHPNVVYIESFAAIEEFLKKNHKNNDLIITMGAGDVFKIADNLI